MPCSGSSATGSAIVTWDHRGHGGSDVAPKRACTIEHLARDMADVIEMHAPDGKLVVGGHSIGGMTIMALAEQRPEIFERVVGTAFVATCSGELHTVTLGLPEMGRFVRSQIPRVLAFRSRTLTKRARRRAPIIERRVVSRFLFGRPMRLADAALTVDGIISSSPATMVGFYEDCMHHDRAARAQGPRRHPYPRDRGHPRRAHAAVARAPDRRPRRRRGADRRT